MVISGENGHFWGAERGEMRGKRGLFVVIWWLEMHEYSGNLPGLPG